MSTRTTRHTRGAVLAVALATGLALAACSGDESSDDPDSTTEEPTAQDRLEQARDVLVEAGTVRLSMTGEDLPDDQSSLIISATGSGTMDPPAFDGTITARLAGVQADVPTIATDGKLYVKLPYVPSHVETDPASLNVPDPATLFDPESGLVGLLGQTEDPEFGERSRVGAETVQEITGTLPGQAVTDLLYVGDANAAFDVTYGLVEDSWELRTVRITGPFYPPAESTYTVTLDEYGAPVTVTTP